MPSDRFDNYSPTMADPSDRSVPVVPHDANELAEVPRAIHVGTGGTIVGRLKRDTADRTFKLAAGLHAFRFKLIKATGTTAADIVALY